MHTTTARPPARKARRIIAIAAVLLPVAAAGVYVAWPEPSAAQKWIKDHPGGRPAGGEEVVYNNDYRRFIVTLERSTGNAQPDCPPGWVCVYAQPGFGYPRGRTQACGYINVTRPNWFPAVQSAHNHLPAEPTAAAEVRLFHLSASPPSDDTIQQITTLNPANPSYPQAELRIDFLHHNLSPIPWPGVPAAVSITLNVAGPTIGCGNPSVSTGSSVRGYDPVRVGGGLSVERRRAERSS